MIKILLSTRLGERRWTQADLARKTGIRAATIGLYYHELVDTVDMRHLDLMCAALECQPGDLIVYDPKAPQEDRRQRRKHKKKDKSEGE